MATAEGCYTSPTAEPICITTPKEGYHVKGGHKAEQDAGNTYKVEIY